MLLVEFFSNHPAPIKVTITYFSKDGTELTSKGGSDRSVCQIDLKPYLGPPGDDMESRIVNHCQPIFSGHRRLPIIPKLRKAATRVSFTFSMLDQEPSPPVDRVLHLERRKSQLGLGDRPTPNYGFPLTLPDAHERIEWLAQHSGLLGSDEWRARALERVLNLIYGGADSPLVVCPLSHHNKDVNRVMGGIIKFAKKKTRYSALGWKSMTEEPMASVASESAIDPERRSWQLEVVESLLEECTPDRHILEFVGRALKREDGTSLKKLSDEFDIHYPTARSYVHRAKKYLGLV